MQPQMQLRWDKGDLNSYYYHTGSYFIPLLNRIDKLLSSFDIHNYSYEKQNNTTSIEILYNDIVTALTNSARLYIPERRKSFLADRTIGRAYGTVCRLSVCRLSVVCL